jgi:hypothetical protein
MMILGALFIDDGRSPASQGRAAQASPEAPAGLRHAVSVPDALADALLSVVDAVRDYLPPDGISKDEALTRIIGALDNAEINPFIREFEHGRS